MTASPVRTFGKYLLDDEIARGGMSRVFLARLRGLGGFEKRLVVKQVLPELASDPRFVTMFVQEAKTLVQMSHPHIAPVYELGVVDGVYFLAMEYVDGATLSQVLKSGPLAPELVAHVGAQICSALHYAHERFAIVHRDVTPRNVIVDEEGHARLLDFGIAAPVTGEAGDGLFGTPGYLSPEQANARALGPVTDVFSLGAVLFEALTARQAFFARNVEEAREVLTMDGPDFYPDDQVPEALIEIVDHALERDPAQRPSSARELGRALRSWLASNAPEGVGPELGDRVRDAGRGASSVGAEAASPKTARTEPADDEVKSDGEVRTLATSQILDDLLEGKRTPATPPIVRAARPENRLETEPQSVEPDDDGPRTLAISRPSAEPSAPGQPAAREPRERSRAPVWAFVGILAVAAVGFLAWPAPESVPPAPPRMDAPAIPSTDPEPAGSRDPEGPATPERPELTETPSPPDAPPDPPEAPTPPPTPPETPSAPERPTERVARATLTVNALPWAEVELDGRPLGSTPLRRRGISSGRHTLVLRNPNLGNPIRTRFEVPAGGTITLIGNLETGSIERRNR